MIRSMGICFEILKLVMSNMAMTKEKSLMAKANAMRCLVTIFARYGGLLGKIAQMLSLDTKDSDVFNNCDPLSSEKTKSYVIKEVSQWDIYKDILQINPEICNSGSLGQVYKGNTNGQDIIFKIQLCDLEEQVFSDFKIIDFLLSNVYTISHIENAIHDIRHQIEEEMNYINEATNQETMYNLYLDDPNITIPKVYTELCTKTTIVMEYMDEFESMPSFIDNSTPEERDNIGNILLKFIFENIYKHGIYYSDSHYGNFMVKDKSILCVLDFGCIHRFNATEIENLKEMHRSMLVDNKQQFVNVMKKMGIITDEVSVDTIDYFHSKLKTHYTIFSDEHFTITDEWVDESADMDMTLLRELSLPLNVLYLQKIPYGLYHILSKLNISHKNAKYINDTYIINE